MSTGTLEQIELTVDSAPSAQEPFDLDITTIEFGEAADKMIQMTDDGCSPSCPQSCTTAAL